MPMYYLSVLSLISMLIVTARLGPAVLATEPAAKMPRPRLQIINGSESEIELFWLKTPDDRVPTSKIPAGESTIIDTTLGHRFVLVGRDVNGEVLEREVESRVVIQGVRFDPDSAEGIPKFYTQATEVNGFPIVAAARVSPYALQEAKFIVEQMMAKRPDVLQAIADSGARLCIMARDQYTTDLPEFQWLGRSPQRDFPQLDPRDYWDARARGTGGSQTDPFCSCAEENLLGFPGDPYAAECILIHEFAHCIHLRGMSNIDLTFDKRLQAAFEAAMVDGLWKGKYASVNHHEYFAEGVQSWFNDNRENDHDHNHVNTRAELLDYDPRLAELCQEVFGDTDLQYSKPATRLTGHLQGYDPSNAPSFRWPPRLKNAQAAIREHAQQRSDKATGKRPNQPPRSQKESPKKSQQDTSAKGQSNAAKTEGNHEIRQVVGWELRIHRDLLQAESSAATHRAIELLTAQLEEVTRVVPASAVKRLKKVTLWFSSPYPDSTPGAAYHPNINWLRENGRDPAMAKCIEFTNIKNFEAETRRMPNFALHELSHAYHDQCLPQAFRNPDLRDAYDRAKQAGIYDSVERQDSEGNRRLDRAYALTNPQEYFAETSEAYFSRNDFFPFNREELQRHDPAMCELLPKLWSATEKHE
ncbi:MAG: hypothetical protein R3C53_22795 [Pirellulaceae bacterium]